MANDDRLAAKLGYGLTPLAEEISAQLSCDGDGIRTQHIVVPCVAGIMFASLGPAAASTTSRSRGSTSNESSVASVRVGAVLARLEGEDGAVVRRFVLEDFNVFCDDGARVNHKRRRSTKRRTTKVPLPISYAGLLEVATSPCPSPGPGSSVCRVSRRL